MDPVLDPLEELIRYQSQKNTQIEAQRSRRRKMNDTYDQLKQELSMYLDETQFHTKLQVIEKTIFAIQQHKQRKMELEMERVQLSTSAFSQQQ